METDTATLGIDNNTAEQPLLSIDNSLADDNALELLRKVIRNNKALGTQLGAPIDDFGNFIDDFGNIIPVKVFDNSIHAVQLIRVTKPPSCWTRFLQSLRGLYHRQKPFNT